MKFWVGVTDRAWFEFLRSKHDEEVNFWQPSNRPLAKFLDAGTPFLFKLHAPHNVIAGGGFFLRFSALPARIAWTAFGQANGVASYADLRARIRSYRPGVTGDPVIACNILHSPFFWAPDEWIPAPPTWSRNIVRGKTFDTGSAEGASLWAEVDARNVARAVTDRLAAGAPRFGTDYLAHARLGQGAFRVLVTEAYGRRCAVTGERTLPVLEAAHIKPYAEAGPHQVANGVLLRSDWHTLFDRGYLTFADDLRVEVSRRIREEFENGRDYYAHHGRNLVALPALATDRPAPDFLAWHREHVYLG